MRMVMLEGLCGGLPEGVVVAMAMRVHFPG